MYLPTERQHARHLSDPSADTALLIEMTRIESSGSTELRSRAEDQPHRHEFGPDMDNDLADMNVPVGPEGFKSIANLYVRQYKHTLFS